MSVFDSPPSTGDSVEEGNDQSPDEGQDSVQSEPRPAEGLVAPQKPSASGSHESAYSVVAGEPAPHSNNENDSSNDDES